MPGDASPDVHRDPSDLPVDDLALSCVQSSPHLKSQLPYSSYDRVRATDCSCRSVKGSKEAVACCVNLSALVPCELMTNQAMVFADEFAPASIAHLGQLAGGV